MFMMCVIAGVPGDSHVYDVLLQVFLETVMFMTCYYRCSWRQSCL